MIKSITKEIINGSLQIIETIKYSPMVTIKDGKHVTVNKVTRKIIDPKTGLPIEML